MRDRFLYTLAGAAGAAIVLGAFLSLSGVRGDQQPVVLSGEAVFPDYSAGPLPGVDPANEVKIRIDLGTNEPWIQGERHELTVTVNADPGPEVSSVNLTTLILYLERPSFPRRDILNSDLVLLKAVGPNRWGSMDGPLVLFPNLDVSGSSFFLTFALSLNVDYENGASYGYGGWNPGVWIDSPDIVPDLAPYGWMLIAAGTAAGIALGIARVSARPRPPVAR